VRIPRSLRDLQVERESQFSDFSSQRLFHGLDLFFGQRRQQLSICAVVSDTMSYDHEGQGSVHVLVDDHLASSQGRTPLGPLELHDQVAKAHGVILPARHRLARHKSIRPEDICHEEFISTARASPVLKSVLEQYAAKIGIRLRQTYDAETLSGGMSLVASTGGFTIVPVYVQNSLLPSVVARALHEEPPTIDLVMGYNRSNTAPLLKKFLLRAEELAKGVLGAQISPMYGMKDRSRRHSRR